MTDDRSERLRKRRKQSANHADRAIQDGAEATSPTPNSQPQSEPNEDRESADETENTGETTSIKENQIGTYMYLPESQTKDLRRLYNVLKAEYEFKYDEEFEKNRHFYPLVIQFGLDSLDSMDASEIRTKLHEIR